MELNDSNISVLWPGCPGKENREDYLPKDIISPREASYPQKKSAKKAILWLLSKAPHAVDEIAEHFELSPELVKYLIRELMRDGLLKKETNPLRYKVVVRADLSDISNDC